MTPARLLTFERNHPRHDGTKEEAIRAELGLTPARYYVLLSRAARTVEGMAFDAITARRVRERRRAVGGYLLATLNVNMRDLA